MGTFSALVTIDKFWERLLSLDPMQRGDRGCRGPGKLLVLSAIACTADDSDWQVAPRVVISVALDCS